MKRTYRLILGIALAIIMGTLPVTAVLADTTASVTVTAVPSYVSISNTALSGNTTAGGNWLINGITGSGVISTNTTYYTNPNGDTTAPSATVAAGDCYYTVNNTSTVTINLRVNLSNFSGGDAMTNSNTGAAGTTSFGAYAWIQGMTYATDKVILKTSGSTNITNSLAANTNLKWGMTLTTRTNDWTSGSTQTATAVLTATAN